MSIANLEVLHNVTSLHSLCFFSKVYKKQETRRTTFNFSVFLQNFANQWKIPLDVKSFVFPDESHRNPQHFFQGKILHFWQNFLGELRPPNPPNVANFHLRIHAEFPKPRDTFQNAENEGSFFMSKPRNGPNRGMFITVLMKTSWNIW